MVACQGAAFFECAINLQTNENVCVAHGPRKDKGRAFFLWNHLTLIRRGRNIWHVCQRVDTRGFPLFDVARQSNELLEWVESNIGAATDSESGICCWQRGSVCV